jgi:hypothetical protein
MAAPPPYVAAEVWYVDAVGRLHESLTKRYPPEVVAGMILDANGHRMLPVQRRLLHRAAAAPAARYSSMPDDFAGPVAATHKVRMLMKLFGKDLSDDAVARMAADPWMLVAQLSFLSGFVGWMPGTDFRVRLNRQQRTDNGVPFPARRYRKLVRQMRRTLAQAEALKQQVLLHHMRVVGQSGLAYSITEEEMRADPDAACFVAYWTARKNRRREFTLAGRDNPFDVIAEMLYARCEVRGAATDWWMLARVYPRPAALARIGQDRLGELLGQWVALMRLTADRLEDLHRQWPADFDHTRMVVRPGMDLSTWNAVAQAYNAARAGWLACLETAGAVRLLNAVCPGKAMRLMAADLVSWHTAPGSVVDPQTAVWAALPKPWDVLNGTACPARTVELVCNESGVDPRATGWTAAAQHGGQVADWKPTPELVHGVEVTDPLWAGLLRRAGVFSGRPLTTDDAAVAGAYLTEHTGSKP